ncbi:MAG TPA: exodeoxyribonuclease I [Halothiobacillaceae bacterium]|nr:exodeoxyribonuclease I [Halothiobacillaceae bacterium]
MARFVFYDLEATGADVHYDRPLQFAAICTNEQLEPIEEPVVWYARHPDDVLSHPAAVMTTGLLPDTPALTEGMSEAELAEAISGLLNQPDTCAVGFNNLRFDAPMLRFLFWRTLKPPYEHEFSGGNSKFDILDVARAYRLLRPDGINWPRLETGYPSLKLTELAAANGLTHEQAHDALSDVQATLELARLFRDQNPRLFNYLLAARNKNHVREQVDKKPGHAFVHTTARIAADRGGGSVFVNLGQSGKNPNARLLWDARFDPAPWMALSPEALAERRFVKTPDDRVNDPNTMRLPVKELHINQVPAVFPLSILKEAAVCERMVIDREQVLAHIALIKAHLPEFAEKLHAAMALSEGQYPPAKRSEQALYAGFLDNREADTLAQWWRDWRGANHPAKAQQAITWLLGQDWQDARLPTLVAHFVARNYPQYLDERHQQQWQHYCREQLNPNGEISHPLDDESGLPRDIPHMRALAQHWLDTRPAQWTEQQLSLLKPYLEWLERRKAILSIR